ncbi:hypothetical protein [Leptolyngbya sp. O-77]|uniref:hypothetical protein n=1 Tax=Leptolyngbya sp. O-77 TaxID=1080068 RepID=UPI00074D3B99|nr:hypothetical protein [Leptolyngbya sp. O-77]BAU41489.1 hypothetical protein O77CONTIG1_01299 [Leptolyngbya sp. O-77]
MKIQYLLVAVITAVASAIPFAAKADTVDARCDIYPRGEDRASAVTACTFSQRQGNVGIQLQDGRRYDLTPVGNQPGNYVDQNGQPAYRQSGLGDRGQIYRFANESIYVYWDTAGIPSASASTSGNPVTYTTVIDYNHINIQITEGEFRFRGTLTKLPGPDYSGTDGRVRVVLTPSTGRVLVFNEVTGTTFYDYTIPPVSVGEDPSTMCDPTREPC